MFNFVTLFDKNYFSRGIALYNSLAKHCESFFLYILAMDAETENLLVKEKLKNISIIQLTQIEQFYPELIEIKKGRSRAEYCWTLTPYSIQYAIKKYALDSCTYIDADIFFYNDPKILFDSAGNNSIIITEHRYTPIYDQAKTNGKYCVQFVFFRNDIYGMEALEWWRHRCSEWCYARCKNGKFGDQKYLDDWTTRFEQVYVPNRIGCGLAPWNIQQYDLSITDDILYAQDKITKQKDLVIFYHFHSLKMVYRDSGKIIWNLADYGYHIDNISEELIYADYLKNLPYHNDTPVDILSQIKKPAFISIVKRTIKNTMSNLNIIKIFLRYKNAFYEECNIRKRNIRVIRQPSGFEQLPLGNEIFASERREIAELERHSTGFSNKSIVSIDLVEANSK